MGSCYGPLNSMGLYFVHGTYLVCTGCRLGARTRGPQENPWKDESTPLDWKA